MSQLNRRAHQRKPLQAECWIAKPPGDTWTPVSTVDVSTGGFAFISPEPVALATVRQFRLQLPNDGGLMHVEGRIMHCVGPNGAAGYRVGVQAITVDLIDLAGMFLGPNLQQPDPKLDLVLTRTIDVPREQVWAAWTKPEYLKQWFTPAPWKTVDCDIDLRPGGIFRTLMQGPDGQTFANLGTYLEIVENEKLVWTNALLPGYRPANVQAAGGESIEFKFTAVIALAAHGKGTKYTATILHVDEEDRRKHEGMGFYDGWNAALDQLVALARTM